MTKTTTIINSNSLNNNEPEKDYKTFSVHESNLSIVKSITKTLLSYKHLENKIGRASCRERVCLYV